MTTFPYTIKGEALNCFLDPSCRRRKLYRFACGSSLSLSLMCPILWNKKVHPLLVLEARVLLIKGSPFSMCVSIELGAPFPTTPGCTHCVSYTYLDLSCCSICCSFCCFHSIPLCSIRLCLCPSDARHSWGRVQVEAAGWDETILRGKTSSIFIHAPWVGLYRYMTWGLQSKKIQWDL